MDPVAVFWDIENCPKPKDVHPQDVAGNIALALGAHPGINGTMEMIGAYGDFRSFTEEVTEAYQKTGVKVVHVPNRRKDAADMVIVVEMFLFAMDNRRPATILLISGDVDFAPALHNLRHRGYKIIVAIPSWVKVSDTMKNAGNYIWDWCSLARGKLGKRAIPHHNKEQKAAEREQHTLKQKLPLKDLKDVKGKIVKLLECSRGSLALTKLPHAYKRMFGKPLCVDDYGVSRMSKLLRRMEDSVMVEGEGKHRVVCLSKSAGV